MTELPCYKYMIMHSHQPHSENDHIFYMNLACSNRINVMNVQRFFFLESVYMLLS